MVKQVRASHAKALNNRIFAVPTHESSRDFTSSFVVKVDDALQLPTIDDMTTTETRTNTKRGSVLRRKLSTYQSDVSTRSPRDDGMWRKERDGNAYRYERNASSPRRSDDDVDNMRCGNGRIGKNHRGPSPRRRDDGRHDHFPYPRHHGRDHPRHHGNDRHEPHYGPSPTVMEDAQRQNHNRHKGVRERDYPRRHHVHHDDREMDCGRYNNRRYEYPRLQNKHHNYDHVRRHHRHRDEQNHDENHGRRRHYDRSSRSPPRHKDHDEEKVPKTTMSIIYRDLAIDDDDDDVKSEEPRRNDGGHDRGNGRFHRRRQGKFGEEKQRRVSNEDRSVHRPQRGARVLTSSMECSLSDVDEDSAASSTAQPQSSRRNNASRSIVNVVKRRDDFLRSLQSDDNRPGLKTMSVIYVDGVLRDAELFCYGTMDRNCQYHHRHPHLPHHDEIMQEFQAYCEEQIVAFRDLWNIELLGKFDPRQSVQHSRSEVRNLCLALLRQITSLDRDGDHKQSYERWVSKTRLLYAVSRNGASYDNESYVMLCRREVLSILHPLLPRGTIDEFVEAYGCSVCDKRSLFNIFLLEPELASYMRPVMVAGITFHALRVNYDTARKLMRIR